MRRRRKGNEKENGKERAGSVRVREQEEKVGQLNYESHGKEQENNGTKPEKDTTVSCPSLAAASRPRPRRDR